MVILRSYFAEEGYEMQEDSNVRAKTLFCSLNFLSGDVLAGVAAVVCLSSLISSCEENLEQLKVLSDDKLNLYFLPSSGDSKVSATSPLSPSELLVALHQIEAKSDMKSVMKGKLNLSVHWSIFCGYYRALL